MHRISWDQPASGLRVNEMASAWRNLALTHENGRALADALVSSREPSQVVWYRDLTWHDKTGTCQRQNPMADANEPCRRARPGTHAWEAGRAVRLTRSAAVAGTSPTVRQRELGKRLRELRNQHNMTVEEVAENLLCSATKISRLETGARRPNPRDVRDLCRLYNLDESTTAELMGLARGAREHGWWTEYEDLG